MTYVPQKGHSLLIPTGGGHFHLFVILTDKCPKGLHLLVNISSCDPNVQHDTTCEVNPGDHRFVNHASYAVYGLAVTFEAAYLTAKVDGQIFKQHDNATPALVARMITGILVSPFTKPLIKTYYRQLIGALQVVKKRVIKRPGNNPLPKK